MFRKTIATDFVDWGINIPRQTMSRSMGGVAHFLAGLNLSIRAKILLSLGIVILLMGLTNIVLMFQMWNYSRQYDAMMNNITTANSINGHIKTDIDTEMWNIVAGKTQFAQGKQYDLISGVNNKLLWMTDHAVSAGSKLKLEVISRTMKTLTHYVDVMGEQIAQGSTVAQNEAVLENIRSHGLKVEPRCEFVAGYIKKHPEFGSLLN